MTRPTPSGRVRALSATERALRTRGTRFQHRLSGTHLHGHFGCDESHQPRRECAARVVPPFARRGRALRRRAGVDHRETDRRAKLSDANNKAGIIDSKVSSGQSVGASSALSCRCGPQRTGFHDIMFRQVSCQCRASSAAERFERGSGSTIGGWTPSRCNKAKRHSKRSADVNSASLALSFGCGPQKTWIHGTSKSERQSSRSEYWRAL